MSFREERYQEKKEAIFDKAAEIFERKGYEKATLDEISAALKITKGSLYYYVKNKEDILFQCTMRAHALANEMLSEIVKCEGLSPSERLGLAIKKHIKLITRKYVYFSLSQQDMLLSNKLQKTVRVERDRFQKMFMAIIRDGMQDGTYAHFSDLKMVSFAILGAINWIPRWYRADGTLSPEKIGEIFTEFMMKGLAD